jgi:transcriptional regulator with XRE-family HTH domain
MDRSEFTYSFSKRLNSLLQKEGFNLNRSKAGIDVVQLAKVAGVSYQMARKYVLGLALPDYQIVPKLAKWFNVSPGWLLFGEEDPVEPEFKSTTSIEIESELLKYILQKCAFLFPQMSEIDKVINFIVGVIYDASHIDTDNKTTLKIIDMMLASAVQLSDIYKVREHGNA